jgi:formate hydrogenlyase subunit 6/NADH:ubiquinone oxidoreductase subunit I
MSGSVFSTIGSYFRDVFRGMKSIFGSVWTALPYWIHFRAGDLRKEVTEQYPDPVSSRTPDDLPPRTRGLLFNDIEKCTGCRDCEQSCPVQCITIENEKGPDAQKTWVAVFDVDFGRCTFCGLCAEVCAPQSLVHTRQFEGTVYEMGSFVTSFGRGRVTQEQRLKWDEIRRQSQLEEPNL